MGKSKKICLFIVEGIADQISLAVPLKRLFQNSSDIRFEITYGDITSDTRTNTQNVLAQIGNIINRYLKINKLKKSDLLSVVQIIDMDGTYISAENVLLPGPDYSGNLPYYGLEYIYASSIDNLVDRNNRKSDNINRIRFNQCILNNIQYRVYYFSCNMDHVLHGNANLSNEQKTELAAAFAEKYKDDLNGFLKLLSDKYPENIERDYKSSWEFIEQGNRSLEAWSNFVLFIELTIK